MKALPLKEDYEPHGKHKHEIMKALVHGSDVGNPARPFNICKDWALKILSEFFAQVSIFITNQFKKIGRQRKECRIRNYYAM